MQIPDAACYKCGYRIDSTSNAYSVDDSLKPHEGDYSMCLNCGAISIFNKDLSLRVPTEEESLVIAGNPKILQAQLARDVIVP